MGASPLAGKFPMAFNPPPFGNFQKHLTHLSEISEKIRDGTKLIWQGLI
jgi:hypothetical protein